jgi:CheY-like chemotaxis protein
VSNGKECVENLLQTKTTIYLMDIQMPKWMALKYPSIRDHYKNKVQLKLLLYVPLLLRKTREKKEQGFNDTLPKPINVMNI